MTPTAMLAAVLAATAPAAPTRYVLALGNDAPVTPGLAPLRFADDDAARMFELLAPGAAEAILLTRFDADSQALFGPLLPVARPPTRAELEAALDRLGARLRAAQGPTELYLYFAAHGDVEEGQGFLHLADGRFTRTELREALTRRLPATRTHVIIDACNSYFMVAGRGPGGRREPYARPFVGTELPDRVGFVVSTSSDAESHEWAALGGGIFSHEVRSALLGAADADGDGDVDYTELGAFVAAANAGVTVPRYRPAVFVRAPASALGAAVFAPNQVPGASTLRVGTVTTGRLSVTDERGFRYVDVLKSAGMPLQLLLLAPRHYEVRLGDASYSVEADGHPVELARLTPEATALVASRGEAHRAFEHLFSRPFGPEVVLGYELGRSTTDAPAELATVSNDPVPTILVTAGTALVAGGAVMLALAADARSDAASAAQADRPALDDRARGLGWGAAGAFAVGLGALGTAIWWTW